MARYTGPKNKLSRREGTDLGMKTVGSHAHASLLRRMNVPPGQHGPKGKKKVSNYGLQLREKQRARRTYGILEKQFRKYFEEATKTRGATGEVLLQLLERRLDNVLYRLALAPTRASARQMVTHGHIRVDGKKVTIPSFRVNTDNQITYKEKSLELPVVKQMLDQKNPVLPGWLERQGAIGRVTRIPGRDDMDSDIHEQLIVEYYSR